jgi:hypothetical protein
MKSISNSQDDAKEFHNFDTGKHITIGGMK